jgi:hypothetical protein
MTELGKELEEAFNDDTWELTDHTVEHKASRIQLWIASGYPFFRLYRAPNVSEGQLKTMLNRFDLCVLWRGYTCLVKSHTARKKTERNNLVLNTLRLARIKAQGEKL